jgi:hypothetical protein
MVDLSMANRECHQMVVLGWIITMALCFHIITPLIQEGARRKARAQRWAWRPAEEILRHGPKSVSENGLKNNQQWPSNNREKQSKNGYQTTGT